MKDYHKHDHTHCNNQAESPCGIKETHRCCLCLEPSPQLEEQGGGADSNAIRFGNIPETISTTGGNGASQQPEEWKANFKRIYTQYNHNSMSMEFHPRNTISDMMWFIENEICKAEERFADKVVKMVEYEKSFDERGKNQFSKGAVKAAENIIRRVEALKK